MPTYVAFLRAVNLGKNRKYPMAELRAALDEAGFSGVETYIQTGNVRLDSPLRSPAKVAGALEQVFAADRGFDVPTVVLTARELRVVSEEAAALDPPFAVPASGVRRYVTLLREEPAAAAAEAVEALSGEGEAAVVRGRAVHLWVRGGYRGARISNSRVEKLLGVATTRDLKVVTALAQRWGA